MTTAVATTKPPSDIGGLLEFNRGAILQALPKTIKADRFLRVCMNAIGRNPDLQKCTATSLYAGIMQSAQFGLEIGLMNQAHLVPYWNSEKRSFEAQFQIGYLGLRDLAERYGDVTDGDAQAVHEKDFFDYGQGDTPFITHKPSKDQDRGPITHFYCWAQPKDGKIKVAVMSTDEVEEHKKKFVREKKNGGYGPAWTSTFDAMALKTVIRRCYKLLARSPELREAVALDEMQEVNIPQNLGMELDIEQKDAARIENAKRLEDMQKAGDTPSQILAESEDKAAADGAGQVLEAPAIHQQSSDALPPSDPMDNPAYPYMGKLNAAHTVKDVNAIYQAIPETIRQDCYVCYTNKLKSLGAKK
jgi:recombination protein RecT